MLISLHLYLIHKLGLGISFAEWNAG